MATSCCDFRIRSGSGSEHAAAQPTTTSSGSSRLVAKMPFFACIDQDDCFFLVWIPGAPWSFHQFSQLPLGRIATSARNSRRLADRASESRSHNAGPANRRVRLIAGLDLWCFSQRRPDFLHRPSTPCAVGTCMRLEDDFGFIPHAGGQVAGPAGGG